MSRSGRIVTVALLAATAAAIAVAVVKAREIQLAADEKADDIEAQLDELDPATRAAVVAKLSADAVQEAKIKLS